MKSNDAPNPPQTCEHITVVIAYTHQYYTVHNRTNMGWNPLTIPVDRIDICKDERIVFWVIARTWIFHRMAAHKILIYTDRIHKKDVRYVSLVKTHTNENIVTDKL